MSQLINFVQFGKLHKTVGFKGKFIYSLDDGVDNNLKVGQAVFLWHKAQFVPFFIQELTQGEISFESIDNKEFAKKFSSHGLFWAEEDIEYVEIEESDLEYGDLIGFQILDKKKGLLGKIDDIVSYPQQELASMQYGGKEYLIPLNDTFIIEIDNSSQIVSMDLPDGLLVN